MEKSARRRCFLCQVAILLMRSLSLSLVSLSYPLPSLYTYICISVYICISFLPLLSLHLLSSTPVILFFLDPFAIPSNPTLVSPIFFRQSPLFVRFLAFFFLSRWIPSPVCRRTSRPENLKLIDLQRCLSNIYFDFIIPRTL